MSFENNITKLNNAIEVCEKGGNQAQLETTRADVKHLVTFSQSTTIRAKALNVLGIMHCDTSFGKPDYESALRQFIWSSTPESLYNAGLMCEVIGGSKHSQMAIDFYNKVIKDNASSDKLKRDSLNRCYQLEKDPHIESTVPHLPITVKQSNRSISHMMEYEFMTVLFYPPKEILT